MPAKRKAAPKRGVSIEPQSTKNASTTKRQNACERCRARKLKCERLNGGNAACKRCEDNGTQAECVAGEPPISQGSAHGTRSQSLPPSAHSIVSTAQTQTKVGKTACTAGRKRGYSEANPQAVDLGQQCTRARIENELDPIPVISSRSTQCQNDARLGLEPIRESDEEDFQEVITSRHGTSRMDDSDTASMWIMAWSPSASSQDTAADDEDSNELNGSNNGSFNSDNSNSVEISEPHHKPYARLARAGEKGAGRKPPSKAGGKGKNDSDASNLVYDPETCVFKIPAAVKNLDGSYSPFTIESSTSLEDLHNTMAKKLDKHPTTVQLRYKLTNDKPKSPATSVQNEDELRIFIERMRSFLVPRRLANGAVSSRTPKNVTVCFEDATTNSEKSASNAGGKGKKKAPNESTSDASQALETTTLKRQKIMGELQKRWRCEYHSKGSAKDIHCYMEPSDGTCFELTLQDFNFWTNQVIGGDTTVDMKPSKLLLRNARSTRIRQSNKSDEFSGSTAFQMGNHNFIPVPIMFPPTWHAQYQAQTINASNAQHSAVVATSSHNPITPVIGPSTTHNTDSLRIEYWFEALEKDTMRNQKGIEFGKYGRLLAQNGFTRITQLSREIVSINDLRDWLGIDAGTAAFIMEYAQEDVRQFKAAGGSLY